MLARFYERRWRVEVNLRNFKQALKMDVFTLRDVAGSLEGIAELRPLFISRPLFPTSLRLIPLASIVAHSPEFWSMGFLR